MPGENLGQEEEAVEEAPELEEGQADETAEDSSEEEEQPKFNLDGEEYTADQIKQWKQGSMMQEDYTRKTQELAEMRRNYERLMQVRQEPQQPEQFESDEQRQAMELIRAEARKEAEKLVLPMKQEQEDLQVKAEMDKIRSDYKLNDDQMYELLDFASKNQLPSLDIAYKSIYFDRERTNSKLEGEANAKANMQKRRAAVVESGQGNKKQPAEKIDVSKKSWDDLAELASQDL